MLNFLTGFKLLNELMNMQKKEKDYILSFQNRKFRSLIEYVYKNNRFYHNLLLKNNINLSEIKNIDDINKMPIIDKNDIRDNYVDIISKDYDINHLNKANTSGTTGTPLFIYYNAYEDLMRKAKQIRAYKNIGLKIRDNWITIVAPHHYPKISSSIQKMLKIYYVQTVSVFKDIDEQIELLKKYKPDILDGYSTAIYLLACRLEETGIQGINPKGIVTGAELLTKNERDKIESVFNVPVYDQYSSIEFGRIAWECHQRSGYHIDSDNLIVQLLDEENNEVGAGETGKIVCTSLFNYAMPLIRYSVGDFGIPSSDSCSCGINLPMIKSIEGRKDSIIILPDGRKLSPRVFASTTRWFKNFDSIKQFQIVQKRKDFIKIYVNTKNRNPSLGEDLIAHFQKTLGLTDDFVHFEIELVDEIPKSSAGKIRFVISEI
jgi:phenylacetate-CoA ligase